jgi:hypothetical protein
MGSPYERHWWPATSPEPDTAVRAVALAGQDPSFLRAERREDGWHTDGLGAAHPGASQPRGWGELGQCWAVGVLVLVLVHVAVVPMLVLVLDVFVIVLVMLVYVRRAVVFVFVAVRLLGHVVP